MRWLSFFGNRQPVDVPDADETGSCGDGVGRDSESVPDVSMIPTLEYVGSSCQMVLGYSGKHTDGYSGYYWNGEG